MADVSRLHVCRQKPRVFYLLRAYLRHMARKSMPAVHNIIACYTIRTSIFSSQTIFALLSVKELLSLQKLR